MPSNPLEPWQGGVLPTSTINNLTTYVNIILGGLGRITTVASSASLSLTTTEADVPGATWTFQTVGANAILVVFGVFDFDCLATQSFTFAQGRLSIDGTTQAAEAHGTTAAAIRNTGSQMWSALLSAGTHTVKLRALKNNPTPNVAVNSPHTTMTVFVFDQP